MSSVKGVVNRNAKTSGKNSTTNTTSQNADTKDAVPNKTHEKEKLQVNLFCRFHPLLSIEPILYLNALNNNYIV